MPSSEQENGSDICMCGEYRSMHDEQGCRLCGATEPDGCKEFRFHSEATEDQRKHWEQYREKRVIQISERDLRRTFSGTGGCNAGD